MTRYTYLVETTTEKSNFGFKAFSSLEAAQKWAKMFPNYKHKITQLELHSLKDF